MELLLAVLSHLPPHSTSIRPRSSFLPLALSSSRLYDSLAALVDSEVQLATPQQAHRFLAGATRSSNVRRLTLRRQQSNNAAWSFALLSQLVQSCQALRKLTVEGLTSPEGVFEVLDELDSLDRLDLDFSVDGSSSSSASSGLATLSNGSSSEADARADHPLTVVPSSDLFSAFERKEKHCLLLSTLSHLRLVHLDLSSNTASAFLAPENGPCITTIRSLELEEVALTDDQLRRLVGGGGALEELTLRRCTGFSLKGLVEAIKANGGQLRRLDFSAAAECAPSTTATTSASPLASPRRYPALLSASTRLSPPLQHPPPTFIGILDTLLPFFPHLTHLTSSGPLLSPSLLEQLSALTPHLRSLSITSHPHIAPFHLLPLLRSGSSARLQSLRDLSLTASPPVSPLACPSPPWVSPSARIVDAETALLEVVTSAQLAGVQLVGEVFEQTQRKLEWAEKEAKKLAGGMERLTVEGEGKEGEMKKRRKRPGVAGRGW